jgi:hypothetical protein
MQKITHDSERRKLSCDFRRTLAACQAGQIHTKAACPSVSR